MVEYVRQKVQCPICSVKYITIRRNKYPTSKICEDCHRVKDAEQNKKWKARNKPG